MPGAFKEIFQYFSTTQPVNKQYLIHIDEYSGSWDGAHYALGYNAKYDALQYPTNPPFTVGSSSIYELGRGVDGGEVAAHSHEFRARDIFASLHSQYYNNTHELDVMQTVLATPPVNDADTGLNFPLAIKPQEPGMVKRCSDRAVVFSVPQKVFGEGIQPGSFELNGNGFLIKDDEEGNLIDESRNNHLVSSSENLVVDFDFDSLFHLEPTNRLKRTLPFSIKVHTSSSKTPRNILFEKSKLAPVYYEWNNVRPDSDDESGKYHIDFSGFWNPSYELDRALDDHSLIYTSKLHDRVNFSQSQAFSIYSRFKIPPSQSSEELHGRNHVFLFGKGNPDAGRTPFQLKLYHDMLSIGSMEVGYSLIPGGNVDADGNTLDGKLELIQRDKYGLTATITSSYLNDNDWHNIVVQSNGSELEMYIDNEVINYTASNFELPTGQIHWNRNEIGNFGVSNADHLWIGAGVDTDYIVATPEMVQYNLMGGLNLGLNTKRRVMGPLSGSLAEFKIWDKTLSAIEIQSFEDNVSGSLNGYVGNIFYDQGIAAITCPSRSYYDAAQFCTMSVANNHTITEHEYLINIDKNEFGVSTNPSLIENYETGKYSGIISSSGFSPYITTIGLYNDANELLVIGKLGQPIKKSKKYDLNFIVRFDT